MAQSSGSVDMLACDGDDAFVVFRSGYMMRLRLSQCTASQCSSAGEPIFVGLGAQVTYVAPTLWVASPLRNNSVFQYDVGPASVQAASSVVLPRGVIEKGPVVDTVNKRLLVTAGPFVYVITSSSLKVACVYQAAAVVTALPAIESSNFFIADATGAITAVSVQMGVSAGTCRTNILWETVVRVGGGSNASSVVSSLAVTGDSSLVYGSVSAVGSIQKEDGDTVWQFDTGSWLGFPAVSIDGPVWVVSETGRVRAIGLSVTLAGQWRDVAVRSAFLAAASEKYLATSLAGKLCGVATQLARESPKTPTQETGELNALILQGCQVQANLKNGLDPAGHRGNYVHASSFQDYQTILTDIVTIMANIETAQEKCDMEGFELTSQDVADLVSSAAIQSKSWKQKLNMLDIALAAYSRQIQTVRQSTAQALAKLSAQVIATTTSIPKTVAALVKDINTLKKEELLARIASIFCQIGGAVFSAIGGIEGQVGSSVVSKLSGMASNAYEKIKGAIQADQQAIAQLDQEMGDMRKLEQLVVALNQTLAVLSNPTSIGDLPKLLPNIGIAEMDDATLKRYSETIGGELSKNITGSEPALLSSVNQFVYGTQTFLNYVKSWFQIAMQRQQIAGDMESSAIHLVAVQSQAEKTAQATVAISRSRAYLEQQHRQFSQLVNMYAQDMVTQYKYWSLQPVDPAILDILETSGDPSSQQVNEFSLQFDMMRVQAQNNLEAGSITSMQYVVNRTLFPDAYAEFEANGTATIVIHPPEDLSDVVTEVRMLDMRVIPEYNGSTPFQWNVFPIHEGMSSIVNRSGFMLNFTHEPVYFGAGDISSRTNCPSSCSCKMAASASDLFGCNTNYINYSPYGTWTIQGGLPGNGQLTRLRFQFLVMYHAAPGRTNT